MSVQNQINRIKQNISDSLDAVAAYGVPIQTTDSSNELAERIVQIANVLEGFVKYTQQTLTDVQKQQARANIGAIDSSYHDSTKQDTISDLNTIRSGAALGATSVQPQNISNMLDQSLSLLNKEGEIVINNLVVSLVAEEFKNLNLNWEINNNGHLILST